MVVIVCASSWLIAIFFTSIKEKLLWMTGFAWLFVSGNVVVHHDVNFCPFWFLFLVFSDIRLLRLIFDPWKNFRFLGSEPSYCYILRIANNTLVKICLQLRIVMCLREKAECKIFSFNFYKWCTLPYSVQIVS